MSREQRLSQLMLGLADTLVDDFEPREHLRQLADAMCELFPVDAAAVLLPDEHGALRLDSVSPQDPATRSLLGDAIDDGPAASCFRTGEPSSDVSLADERERWPAFVGPALAAGYAVTHLFPLRLRGQIIGVVHLLAFEGPALTPEDRGAAETLSDIATIGIVRDRAAEDRAARAQALQTELDEQVVIEQARGTLLERTGESSETVLRRLVERAVRDGVPLRVVARGVLDGTVDLDD